MKRSFITALSMTLALFCVMALSIQAGVPQAAASLSDSALQMRIQAALNHTSDLNGTRLTVTVKKGIVTLSGRVSTQKLRDASYPEADLKGNLRSSVRGFPGVKDVVFSLQVNKPR